MRKFFAFSIAAVMALAMLSARADDAKDDKEPSKDVTVKVIIPKTFKVTETKVAGGETAQIPLKIEITNKTDKIIAFSRTQVKVKIAGALDNMISVGKGQDATPIKSGETLKTERTIFVNTIVFDDGKECAIDVNILGHKTSGKSTAKK